jgi:hypothetical protein
MLASEAWDMPAKHESQDAAAAMLATPANNGNGAGKPQGARSQEGWYCAPQINRMNEGTRTTCGAR